MIRWKDKHAYNWIGIGESLHERYDTLPIGIQILTSPLYILLGILFTLHKLDFLMNLYCDMSERLLQKPNGLWSIMKAIVLIPLPPMMVYVLPVWIYNKVKSRKVHISNDPWEDIENRMEQSRVHRGDLFQNHEIRPKYDKLSPTKKIITHKMGMT